MSIHTQIAFYRKKEKLTQEALAEKLGISNQAVSKWESGQSCPDIMLLPKLADIFHISLDRLFEREFAEIEGEDDDPTLHIQLMEGNRRVKNLALQKEVHIYLEGSVRDIKSDFSVSCGEVMGNIEAAGSVNCDAVHGNVTAGGSVNCDDIYLNARAGGNITCDDIAGSASAGGSITCDSIGGHASAGRSIN